MSAAGLGAAVEDAQRRIDERRQALLAAQRGAVGRFEEYARGVEAQEREFAAFEAGVVEDNRQQLADAEGGVALARRTVEEAREARGAFEESLAQLERRLFHAAVESAEGFRPESTQRFDWASSALQREKAMSVLPALLPSTAAAKEERLRQFFYAASPVRGGEGARAVEPVDLAQSIEHEISVDCGSRAPAAPPKPAAPLPPVLREYDRRGFPGTNMRLNAERVSEHSRGVPAGGAAGEGPPSAPGAALAQPRPLAATSVQQAKSSLSRDGFESFESKRNASKLAKAQSAGAGARGPRADPNDFDGVLGEF